MISLAETLQIVTELERQIQGDGGRVISVTIDIPRNQSPIAQLLLKADEVPDFLKAACKSEQMACASCGNHPGDRVKHQHLFTQSPVIYAIWFTDAKSTA